MPYRVDPGGKAGVNYDKWIGDDFAHDGVNWATWIKTNVPGGGNILFMGGPAGNSQSIDRVRRADAEPALDSYKFVGQTAVRSRPTGTRPRPRQLLSADDREVPEDRRHRLRLRPDAGQLAAPVPGQRPADPGAGHLRRQLAELLLEGQPGEDRPVQDDHGHHRQRQRPARGGLRGRQGDRRQDPRPPTSFQGPVFEDSVSGKPHPVTCQSDLPGDVYLSAQMPGEEQAQLGK